MRGISVLVAGAGLAGLTAAHELKKNGARVTVVESRDRVGGRVVTAREPFLKKQHAELGGDLIDESQTEICRLINRLSLRTATILPGGFTGVQQNGSRRRLAGQHGWYEIAKRLAPEVRAFCLSEQRWDGGVAARLSRESVAQWLDRIRASQPLRDMAIGMRGFFLADPDQLSLVALADQFAEDGVPGGERMFRIVGGNDRLPEALANALRSKVHLRSVLRRVTQTEGGVTAAIESHGRTQESRFDYLVCTLPASTLREVVFEPAMPEAQWQAIATLKYGAATKTALQFDRAIWRRRGRPRAFGTPFGIGAVWDGNEEQGAGTRGGTASKPGILTLLAGGGASAETQRMLASEGPSRILRELSWLDLGKVELTAWTSLSWELEPWSRGGYAFFDTHYDPAIRYWLARPFGRVFFAGEHTSMRWQGYMNGAVETGLRAAEEIVAVDRQALSF
jgi:monoamine oxidase